MTFSNIEKSRLLFFCERQKNIQSIINWLYFPLIDYIFCWFVCCACVVSFGYFLFHSEGFSCAESFCYFQNLQLIGKKRKKTITPGWLVVKYCSVSYVQAECLVSAVLLVICVSFLNLCRLQHLELPLVIRQTQIIVSFKTSGWFGFHESTLNTRMASSTRWTP